MSRPRKKFKDTKVGQFLLGKKGLFSELANTITDNGVLGVIKRLIVNEDSLSVNDKETALALMQKDITEMQEVSKRWASDLNSDSVLSKNVRPAILILFSVAYIIGWYLDYELDNIGQVLSIIIASYFGSRGIEKFKRISVGSN